jgi:hypothetical protein
MVKISLGAGAAMPDWPVNPHIDILHIKAVGIGTFDLFQHRV